jgi:hypothetical protein
VSLALRRWAGIAAAVAIGAMLWPGESVGQPNPTDNNLLLFENLLRSPNEAASNLAYAQTLQASGQIEEAREAYRRVLAIDPANATANAALAALGIAVSPAQTDYTLRVGGAYETNAPRRPPTFRGFDDFVGFGEFTVNDTRQIGDVTVQSNLDLYSNFHNRYSPGDVSYVAVDSGPIFDLASAGKLRVAAGGEYVLQGQSPIPADGSHVRQFEFDAINLILNWFPVGPTPLQSVNLLVGYNDFRQSEASRSGMMVRMTAPFVFPEIFPAIHTQLIATPGVIYNGANDPLTPAPQPAHYNEISLDLLSLTPLAERQLGAQRVIGKVGVFLDGDFYNAHDPGMTSDRKDMRIIPLAGIRLVDFFAARIQVDLDYRFDCNLSNDAAERFTDHIFSLTATYRF